MQRPTPRQPVPALAVPTLDGGSWTLGATPPATFTMVVFYRGLHCPICGRYLKDLDGRLAEFAKRGVEVIAVSGDSRERAAEAKAKWELPHVKIGYGLATEVARAWGLFVSAGRPGTTEPAVFSEPGLFLVRPDGTLYFAAVQTMPFTRPSFAEVLQGIDYITANGYPARGELA